MTFELISGVLRVTGENAADVMEIFKHYRLDSNTEGVLAMADALRAGTYVYETRSKKREWFEVDVYLDERSLAPYRALLKRMTGYDDNTADMDLTADVPNRLGHTHITNAAEIVDGMYHANVFIQAEEWNGQPADVRADRNAADYIQALIGKRKHEQEFIQTRNGQYVHNPKYGRNPHPAEPGLGAPWLWNRIFTHWRENNATDAQRAVLDAADALRGKEWKYDPEYAIRKGGGDEASLVGYSLYVLDPAGKIDYDGKGKMASVWTWDAFAALGKVAAV